MAIKKTTLPFRRGSDSSEKDFFDIPEESILSVVKRQLRYVRTWVILAVFFVLIKWMRREHSPPSHLAPIHYDEVDWSRYAYTTYATSETYLCNCLMVFEALHRLGSKADRLLFYPLEWDLVIDDAEDRISELLVMAKDLYNVLPVPVAIEGIKIDPENEFSRASWDTSTAKLFAFGVVQYNRVIHLDSDITLLQSLDELFFLPPAKIAMPRAYWLLPETKTLSSLMAVIEPSFQEFNSIQEASLPALNGQVQLNLTITRFDMEILNDRYGDTAMVLPHRQYALISGEFRTKDHRKFLGADHGEWNPDKALAEAKFVHFSDWPLPKPWVMWPSWQLAEMQPACDINPGSMDEKGCRDREVWKDLYDDFRRRRKDICRLLSFPAPI
ncbi:Glucose N-acetyltransferase 1 [Penicillium taxi]|uniref:Glucose N-acetyltransferase 1 n=1 Tax=Penicillium taxi TaxID=168475 RepID=UPI002544DFDE|nr:Glucose N-acetyltransferase 1 [Penicillium taxi]KAJ5909201.1 Glucose N-acetyltransferase 1 [Penicillium taxi]